MDKVKKAFLDIGKGLGLVVGVCAAGIIAVLLIHSLLFGIMSTIMEARGASITRNVLVFGEVEVRAYTKDDTAGGKWHDGRTATNKIILDSDYSVAVSPDIELFLDGISNNKGMRVPYYNKFGEFSIVNDRSDLPERSIEVLMTVGNARQRAEDWGVRKGILKAVDFGGAAGGFGRIAWIIFHDSYYDVEDQ